MQENKLGMFIHWGAYSLYGEHEQILARRDLDFSEYESRVMTFDPKRYDPEEWVLLAKRAGMKYICFTAKHHDGFCMWDTKYTDYCIMKTPYGRDVLKMLASACEKHGMLLSIYYSCPDWHHENAYNSRSTHQWKAKNTESDEHFFEYVEYVKNQIRELLSNYGRIYTLFWDIPPHIDIPEVNELVRELQPGIYINDRGFGKGDFSTPERDESPIGYSRFTRMTEACNSVDLASWGYRDAPILHSLRYLTHSIDRVMALGGSYLINVGPDCDGKITEEYADRIEAIGKWYNSLSGVLEAHEPDEYDYGVALDKCIVNKKNGKSYFHFFDGLLTDKVIMKNEKGIPRSVRLMNTGKKLDAKYEWLPASIGKCSGVLSVKYLTIGDIPTDELECEAIVIEIEW